jgi:hypothetical protein
MPMFESNFDDMERANDLQAGDAAAEAEDAQLDAHEAATYPDQLHTHVIDDDVPGDDH